MDNKAIFGFYFTGLAANIFGFNPNYILITGRSSWTLYENNDHTGNATCLIGSQEMSGFLGNSYNFQSISKGCAT